MYLELVSNQVDLVHHSVRCRNVLLFFRDRPFDLLHSGHCFLGAKDHIAGPEVAVENPEGFGYENNFIKILNNDSCLR